MLLNALFVINDIVSSIPKKGLKINASKKSVSGNKKPIIKTNENVLSLKERLHI